MSGQIEPNIGKLMKFHNSSFSNFLCYFKVFHGSISSCTSRGDDFFLTKNPLQTNIVTLPLFSSFYGNI